MTGWSGEAQSTVKLTGRYAGQVRAGRYLVPRHVFFDVVGRDGDPNMHMHFEYRDGRPQVVDLHVKSKPGGRGVRSSDLEPISLDGLAKNVMMEHSRIVSDRGIETPVDWSHPALERERWKLDGQMSEAIASRRGRLRQAELARVAEIYEEFRGRNALQAIAMALDVHLRTAARRVKAAREAGLIKEKD